MVALLLLGFFPRVCLNINQSECKRNLMWSCMDLIERVSINRWGCRFKSVLLILLSFVALPQKYACNLYSWFALDIAQKPAGGTRYSNVWRVVMLNTYLNMRKSSLLLYNFSIFNVFWQYQRTNFYFLCCSCRYTKIYPIHIAFYYTKHLLYLFVLKNIFIKRELQRGVF